MKNATTRKERFFPWWWFVLVVFGILCVIGIAVAAIIVLSNVECVRDADCGCLPAPDQACNYANYSMKCKDSCCQKDRLMLTPKADGSKCGGGVCWAGDCVRSFCPDCESTFCRESVCDGGQCFSEARNEGKMCHEDACGVGVCRDQTCQVRPRCEDGNPCTLDRCTGGRCEHLPILNDRCGGFCESGCGNMTCIDGMCMEMESAGQSLKFVDHTFQTCHGTSYRLVLHFRLFSEHWNATRGTGRGEVERRYLAPLAESDFVSTTHDLGFIDYVVEHQLRVKGDYAETSFSLATQCIDLNEHNCHHIFSRRDYGFRVLLHDCDGELNCLSSVVEVIAANMHLSVNNCPLDLFSATVTQVHSLRVLGPDWMEGIIPFDAKARVLLETPGFAPWIRDARLCVPRAHRNRACALNENVTDCPARGCFGWPDDGPIERHMDIFRDGWVTAAVRGFGEVEACRDFDDYPNMTCGPCRFRCCSPDCAGCPATDGFDFRLRDFLVPGDVGIFDIRYIAKHGCQGAEAEYRSMSYITEEVL